jgi:hypothetical protein
MTQSRCSTVDDLLTDTANWYRVIRVLEEAERYLQIGDHTPGKVFARGIIRDAQEAIYLSQLKRSK